MNMHDRYMHNSFWNERQVAITVQLKPLEPPNQDAAINKPPVFISKPTFINTLNLNALGRFIADQGFILDSLKPQNTARPITFERDDAQRHTPDDMSTMQGMQDMQPSPDDIGRVLADEIGKHLFFPKDTLGRYVPTLTGFFTFTERKGAASDMSAPAQPGMDGMLMPEQGQSTNERNSDDGKGMLAMGSPVARLVNLLNSNQENLRNTLNASAVTTVTVSPTWQCGGTMSTHPDGPVTQGCPLTPPIPVSEVCSTSPGLWPITLPELQPDLQNTTGDGVTVFVLDTLPKLGTIKRAAEAAENDNLLLLDVMENVIPNSNYQLLPDILDVPSSRMPETGKDLYGRIVGFHMADHGLFEAGVIHDIVPDANIECIRVLNDFCVGDLSVLMQSLEGIYNHALC